MKKRIKSLPQQNDANGDKKGKKEDKVSNSNAPRGTGAGQQNPRNADLKGKKVDAFPDTEEDKPSDKKS